MSITSSLYRKVKKQTRNINYSIPYMKGTLLSLRRLTSFFRIMPSFIIVGVQKSGTTSLYKYLEQHPSVCGAFEKEINYFSNLQGQYHKGPSWYPAFFPSLFYLWLQKLFFRRNIITGEASTSYFAHPLAPKRIFDDVPDSKIIIVLRDPVERAHSLYNHNIKRNNADPMTFLDAISYEKKRLTDELFQLRNNPTYIGKTYLVRGYLYQSSYYTHISRWLTYFPRKQVLIIHAEDLFKTPQKIFHEVLQFLQLPLFTPKKFDVFNNKGSYSAISEEEALAVRTFLVDEYRLCKEELGITFS